MNLCMYTFACIHEYIDAEVLCEESRMIFLKVNYCDMLVVTVTSFRFKVRVKVTSFYYTVRAMATSFQKRRKRFLTQAGRQVRMVVLHCSKQKCALPHDLVSRPKAANIN